MSLNKRLTHLLQTTLLLTSLLLSGCDEMRPEPIPEPAQADEQALIRQIEHSLGRLGYAQGQVTANLGQVGQRLELRTLQYNLAQLGYFEGPRLGLLDPVTVSAIEAFLASQQSPE